MNRNKKEQADDVSELSAVFVEEALLWSPLDPSDDEEEDEEELSPEPPELLPDSPEQAVSAPAVINAVSNNAIYLFFIK